MLTYTPRSPENSFALISVESFSSSEADGLIIALMIPSSMPTATNPLPFSE